MELYARIAAANPGEYFRENPTAYAMPLLECIEAFGQLEPEDWLKRMTVKHSGPSREHSGLALTIQLDDLSHPHTAILNKIVICKQILTHIPGLIF